MKKVLLTIVWMAGLFSATYTASAQERRIEQHTDLLQRTAAIDVYDTVVFDITNANVIGNTVAIPVYFHSDDTINALDFSFRYNYQNFVYDTILDATNYMTTLAYCSPNDTIVRFTSYSFQNYSHDTALVIIRFNILSGPFCSSDLNTIHVYLNGDPCTYRVTNCSPNGLNDLHNGNAHEIFPNPANESLHMVFPEDAMAQLFDISGHCLTGLIPLYAKQEKEIDVSKIAEGIYFLRTVNNKQVLVNKVVVAKNQ